MVKIMTKKQKRFVEEYLIDLNATQAAIRAGYSPNSARQIADKNMSKHDIQAAIDKAMAERSKRTGANQDRVVQELAKIAFVNPADIINFDEATVKDTASTTSAPAQSYPQYVQQQPTPDMPQGLPAGATTTACVCTTAQGNEHTHELFRC